MLCKRVSIICCRKWIVFCVSIWCTVSDLHYSTRLLNISSSRTGNISSHFLDTHTFRDAIYLIYSTNAISHRNIFLFDSYIRCEWDEKHFIVAQREIMASVRCKHNWYLLVWCCMGPLHMERIQVSLAWCSKWMNEGNVNAQMENYDSNNNRKFGYLCTQAMCVARTQTHIADQRFSKKLLWWNVLMLPRHIQWAHYISIRLLPYAFMLKSLTFTWY